MQLPVFILVEPTLSENIGAVARAMMNFGFTTLRLVSPKASWTNERARALAAGADKILDNTSLYQSLEDATADLTALYATTARPREMTIPVLSPHEGCREIAHLGTSHQVGILFGSEKCGLENAHIAQCRSIITIPLNPEFTSINLAQSCILIAYELAQALGQGKMPEKQEKWATRAELNDFLTHLEGDLDKSGYFRIPHKKPLMMQTIRTLFSKIPLSAQEIRTLRGLIRTLVSPHGIYSRDTKRRLLKEFGHLPSKDEG